MTARAKYLLFAAAHVLLYSAVAWIIAAYGLWALFVAWLILACVSIAPLSNWAHRRWVLKPRVEEMVRRTKYREIL